MLASVVEATSGSVARGRRDSKGRGELPGRLVLIVDERWVGDVDSDLKVAARIEQEQCALYLFHAPMVTWMPPWAR